MTVLMCKPISDKEFDCFEKRGLSRQRSLIFCGSADFTAATDLTADYGLLLGKLSVAHTDEQKSHFVNNLLQEMRRENMIRPVGAKRGKGARGGFV